jgi:carboxylesterase type B
MMRFIYAQAILGVMAYPGLAAVAPSVNIPAVDVTYRGIHRNGIEAFLNIPYGEDTGGRYRFRPPRPHTPIPGSTIQADSYGPACPQALGGWKAPFVLTNVTEVSEDCLNLNTARPQGTQPNARLPVMVYIHGGSFWTGMNSQITVSPDGLILESVKNELPVIHVIMNYRLGGELIRRIGIHKLGWS